MIFISRELISLALLDWSEVDSDAVYSVGIILPFPLIFNLYFVHDFIIYIEYAGPALLAAAAVETVCYREDLRVGHDGRRDVYIVRLLMKLALRLLSFYAFHSCVPYTGQFACQKLSLSR